MARKVRVLVAEDSALQRSILVAIVNARKNFEAIEAEDGTQAMEILEKQKPDIALLDVEMPGMNGLQICSRMKRDPNLAHIPVMIITATTQKLKVSDEELANRTRADDFITKPFKSADVYKRIDRLLDKASEPLEKKKQEGSWFRWRI